MIIVTTSFPSESRRGIDALLCIHEQALKLKVSPNPYNYFPYEYFVPRILLRKEQSMWQVYETFIFHTVAMLYGS